MHMADALISPAVGGVFWAAAAGSIACCSARMSKELDDHKVPLMGVLGAFIFAAQMINFTIPATGSSGHIGGGLLLAILLGPCAALLSIASVLIVQALFFADGGLLALGCNIFNLGVLPAFIAYPLVYKNLIGQQPKQSRMVVAAILAAVVGLQLGSFGVVAQTAASGIAALPFKTFLALMQPIHLAIGVVEGIVTALVISFVYRARPEILAATITQKPAGQMPARTLAAAFLVAALCIGGGLSWFASENPDGLEWSIAHVTGDEELSETGHRQHATAAALQEKSAILPDYALPESSDNAATGSTQTQERIGTSLSGLVGGSATLLLCGLAGLLLRKRNR